MCLQERNHFKKTKETMEVSKICVFRKHYSLIKFKVMKINLEALLNRAIIVVILVTVSTVLYGFTV